ncbi:MAG: internal scaffolding protein [Microvirus sp.]|nr:MAG: internal scaffolding protein [Microvirus sp.]
MKKPLSTQPSSHIVYTRYNRPPYSAGYINMADALVTKQEFKDECDINNIVNRGLLTGIDPSTPWAHPPVGRYGDFFDVPDYQQALEIIRQSEEQFAALPVRTRERFQHNPEELLRFVNDPANLEAARALGMLRESDLPPAPPAAAPAAPPAAPKA